MSALICSCDPPHTSCVEHSVPCVPPCMTDGRHSSRTTFATIATIQYNGNYQAGRQTANYCYKEPERPRRHICKATSMLLLVVLMVCSQVPSCAQT